MKMLKQILVLTLVTLLLLAISESICKAILQRVYNRDYNSALIQDHCRETSACHKAGFSGKVWGKEYTTDSLGNRKTKTVRGKRKLLFIGDSVTEGVGVADSSMFVNLFSSEDTTHTVLNYSLIGYSISDYKNVVSTVMGSDSSIDQVVIMWCLNDVYGKSKTKELPLMGQKGFISRLNGLLQNRSNIYKLIKLLIYQNSSAYYRYDKAFYRTGNPFYDNAIAELKTCDSICRKNNTNLHVAVLPYRSQLENNDYEPQNLMEDFCHRNQIKYLDVSKGMRSAENYKNLYLFADEIHLSDEGHKAVSKYLLNSILYSHQNQKP